MHLQKKQNLTKTVNELGFISIHSKLTGFVVLSIDYKLAPEASMQSKVKEVRKCYEYLLEQMCINPKNIFVFGESAGGGLSLLFIQHLMENIDKLVMCGGCIMYSGWFNVAGNTPSYKDNANIDAMIVFDAEAVIPKMASCWTDKNGDIYEKNKDKDLLKYAIDGKISAVNGIFDKRMCPMYLMIGASELLLDDSLNVAEKANEKGIDVRVDLSAYLFHTWPIFVNHYEEAVIATVKTAQFINKLAVSTK